MSITLNNGAKVIDNVEYKSLPFDGGDFIGIVVAENRPNEWVTWMYVREDNKGADCHWGHYHSNKDEAMAEFISRVDEFEQQHAAYVRQ